MNLESEKEKIGKSFENKEKAKKTQVDVLKNKLGGIAGIPDSVFNDVRQYIEDEANDPEKMAEMVKDSRQLEDLESGISKLKESVNDFLSYSTEYIQDLQDKIAKLNEENNTLRQQNRFLRMALKYIEKKR